MTTSEQINDIAAALAKAQGEMKNATLNKVNPHFKSKYADLAGIRDAVVPVLSRHGIAVVQTLGFLEGYTGQTVTTRLVHSSGQWIESACGCGVNVADMQKMGSAITYARRYSLSAICGIAADEDDDANAASQPAASRPVGVPNVPPGYEDWLTDLEAVADEGSAALKAAWEKSQPFLRKHLTDTQNAKWEALKAKAAKVKVPASA
jgi:hypothetical protein